MVVQGDCSDVDFCSRVLVTGLVQLSKELNRLDVGQVDMVGLNAERRTTQVMSVRQRQYGISSLAKRRMTTCASSRDEPNRRKRVACVYTSQTRSTRLGSYLHSLSLPFAVGGHLPVSPQT